MKRSPNRDQINDNIRKKDNDLFLLIDIERDAKIFWAEID